MVILSSMIVRQLHPTGSVWLDVVIAISIYWAVSGMGDVVLESRELLYVPGTLAILLSGWPNLSLPYFVVIYVLIAILIHMRSTNDER